MPAAGPGGGDGPLGPLQLLPARLAGGSVQGDARGARNGRASRTGSAPWRGYCSRHGWPTRIDGRPQPQAPGARADPVHPAELELSTLPGQHPGRRLPLNGTPVLMPPGLTLIRPRVDHAQRAAAQIQPEPLGLGAAAIAGAG